MITINNVSHHIDHSPILNNISLSLEDAQVIALIGPNGAGKSTLFSVMSRLQPLQSGSVQFGEYDIAHTDSKIMAKTVAILEQSNQLQGRLRVEELLMFGRYPYHQGRDEGRREPHGHRPICIRRHEARPLPELVAGQ